MFAIIMSRTDSSHQRVWRRDVRRRPCPSLVLSFNISLLASTGQSWRRHLDQWVQTPGHLNYSPLRVSAVYPEVLKSAPHSTSSPTTAMAALVAAYISGVLTSSSRRAATARSIKSRLHAWRR